MALFRDLVDVVYLMRFGGRLQAAIEVLEDLEARKRPISIALKDWAQSHRFAGSGDRAAIGNIVYDVIRQQRMLAWRSQSDNPKDQILALMLNAWGHSMDEVMELCRDDRHAPEGLTGDAIKDWPKKASRAPDAVKANVPDWIAPLMEENFNGDWIEEGRAMAQRPPLDIRTNTLKSDRGKLKKSLSHMSLVETTISDLGLRVPFTTHGKRHPNIQAEPSFQKGWFEVQDEGSQIVAQLVRALPGEQVLDLCAGAGGKTLALAAEMQNKGQIHAFDIDKYRLAPIHERLKRNGVRNCQVLNPSQAIPGELIGKMDRVVIDAPCTGSGVWRRHPDTKWKLTEKLLGSRLIEQQEVLDLASDYVRPGGYMVYITCSILPVENEGQIYTFLEDRNDFRLVSAGEVWQDRYGFDKPQPWSADMKSITLTPSSTHTDGFYLAILEKINV